MKISHSKLLLVICSQLLLSTLLAVEAANCDVVVRPIADVFSKDGPIGIECTVRNTSGNKLWIRRDTNYEFAYAVFSSDSENILERKQKSDFSSAIRRVSYRWEEFAADNSMTFLVYPNVNLEFERVGDFDVKYKIKVFLTEDSNAETRQARSTTISGSVKLIIGNEDVTEKDIVALTSRMDGSAQRNKEIIEGLGYIKDLKVVPYLVKIAKEYPPMIPQASEALTKFGGDKIGLKALEDIGSPFNIKETFQHKGQLELKEVYAAEGLQHVLYAFLQSQGTPSEEFLHKQFHANNDSRILLTLDYLQKRVGKSILEDESLKPLLLSNNEMVRNAAAKVLEKMPKKESKVQEF